MMPRVSSAPRQRRLREIDSGELTAAVDELAMLITVRFPQRVHRGEGQWPIVATALIAQMLSAARSIVALNAAEAHNDVLVLLRALYEQVVTFSWLAIDPDRHLVDWANEAHLERLKLHNDAAPFGYSILTAKEAAAIKTRSGMPPLIQRADEVDRFWAPRIPGFREQPKRGTKQILTIRGLYVGLYRTTSRAAHAHVGSVEAFVDWSRYPRYPAVVQMRRSSTDLAPIAVPLLTLALLVCNDRLGWPDADSVKALNAVFLHDVDPGEAVLADDA